MAETKDNKLFRAQVSPSVNEGTVNDGIHNSPAVGTLNGPLIYPTITTDSVQVKIDNFYVDVSKLINIEKLDATPVNHSEQLTHVLTKVPHWVNRDNVVELVSFPRKDTFQK